MTTSQDLLDQMFSKGGARGGAVGEKVKTAEQAFAEGLGVAGEADDEFDGLDDEQLDQVIAELESEVGAASGEELLDKTASERLGGEVAAHASLHEREMIKQALAAGKCRFCKENPLEPAVHPTLCSGCVPTS